MGEKGVAKVQPDVVYFIVSALSCHLLRASVVAGR